MNKSISIITATYNSASTVADTLKTVSAQDYPHVQHLIVDGLSKDNTLEVVSGFPHVASCISEKDKGIYDAMNKGIERAEGEIIGILNSDDFYANNQVLSTVMKAFEDPSIQLVYGDLQYVDALNTAKVTRNWKAGKYTPRSFYYGWMPPHPSVFVRKEVYKEFGVFDTRLRSAADYEILLRFFLKHQLKATYIPQVLVKMRAGGMSNASLKNRLRANGEDRLAWSYNNLQPLFITRYAKPLRKLMQFIK